MFQRLKQNISSNYVIRKQAYNQQFTAYLSENSLLKIGKNVGKYLKKWLAYIV